MSPIPEKFFALVSYAVVVVHQRGIHLPVKHHPLGNSDDAFLGLVERRELRLDGVISISHDQISPL
jgi:hypothetical protein